MRSTLKTCHNKILHTRIYNNVKNLAQLKQVLNTKLKLDQYSSYFELSMVK